MTVTSIQRNTEYTKSQKTYRDANIPISTQNSIKPLKPKGHLVHDRILSMPKYIIKDFIYDLKAVKDGFKGTANDHQIGRLNDVGLKTAGVGIAAYLASKTSNPVLRVMEYAGLGAFLASMSIYPQLAIQAPSRVLHGFDSGKEYIDDQNRKKSVFQDQNYIPFDMYTGEYRDENLDIIGDRLGIPRNIKNRHDLIREQMRKIATQNNTLWMLSAGFATPVISALFCVGLEKLIAPAMEKARNMSYNSKISSLLVKTDKMKNSEASENSLSKEFAKILSKYENNDLPQKELDNLVEIISKDCDSILTEGIKADLENILQGDSKFFAINENSAEDIINVIKSNISIRDKQTLEKVFVPSKDEIESILKHYNGKKYISEKEISNLRNELNNLFDSKIALESADAKAALEGYRNSIVEKIISSINKTTTAPIDNSKIKDVIEFTKILGEFKKNKKMLDKCASFKFEETQQTVLARSYEKFETVLFDVLGIKFDDMKLIKESEQYTKELLDKKLSELAKDQNKYEKALEKIAKAISEMEVALNGSSADKSNVQDLITAIENNYNNTAKRLNSKNSAKFKNTIDRLVKEDVDKLCNTTLDREKLFDLLDGVNKPNFEGGNEIDWVKYNAKGVGSSKNIDISRIIDRYQGVKNTFNRVINTMDYYKRNTDNTNEFANKCKSILLEATSSDHVLKLNTVNSPKYYEDLMNAMYSSANISENTQKVLKSRDDALNGNLFKRYKKYLDRFKNVIGNNDIDFMKPSHRTGGNIKDYTEASRTRLSNFNLVAQNPVNLIKNAADRKYGTNLWMRRVGIIGGSVLGLTLLAQLGFGKIKNPHNIQKLNNKQVKNDKD